MIKNRKRQLGLILVVTALLSALTGCNDKSRNKPADTENLSMVTPDPIANVRYGNGTECINIVDDFFCYKDGKALRSGEDGENIILLSEKDMTYLKNLKADIDLLNSKVEELKRKAK